MQTAHPEQSTFVGGEVTAKILARTDVERFVTSGLRVENFTLHPQGPISRRRGTRIRNSFGISEDDVLASFLPRRDQGVVLMIGDGRIGIPSIDTDDYETPSTPPSFLSRKGSATLSSIGFERPDGTFYLRQLFDSGPVGLSDGSFNLYQGVNYYDRATRLRVSETFIQPFRDTCNLPDDEDEDAEINPLEPVQDDFFNDPAPGPAYLPGYPTDSNCEVQARDDNAVAYDTIDEYDTATHVLDALSNVILEATYEEEYTEAMLIEDTINMATPTGAFAAGSPTASLDTSTPGTVEAETSDYRLTWDPSELSPGLPYTIEWTETFTPEAGPPVDTVRRYSFVFDGMMSESPIFRLSVPAAPGTITVSSPTWD